MHKQDAGANNPFSVSAINGEAYSSSNAYNALPYTSGSRIRLIAV
jgi:hypothetical protein